MGVPRVLDHLGVAWRPAPGSAHNLGSDKAAFRPGLGRLYRTALFKQHAHRVPGPARRLASRLLLRPRSQVEGLLASADEGPDEATLDRLERDARRAGRPLQRGRAVLGGASLGDPRRADHCASRATAGSSIDAIWSRRTGTPGE